MAKLYFWFRLQMSAVFKKILTLSKNLSDRTSARSPLQTTGSSDPIKEQQRPAKMVLSSTVSLL